MYALPPKMHLIGAIFFITIFCIKKNQSLNATQFSSNRTIIKLHHDTPEYPFRHINYIWTIGRFHFRLKEKPKGYKVQSPTFTIDNEFKWYLEVKPYDGKDDNTFYIYVKLSPDSKKQKARLQFDTFILDVNGSERFKTTDPNFLEVAPHNAWHSDLIPKRDEFFFNDKLTILVNMTYCEDISNFVPHSGHSMRPLWNSSENFTESLFKNREFADVVLLVNETEHPAHKAVLSHRSPVFAAMFRRATEKGKKMKRINITDLNDRVVDEMLRYIYTGKCQHLDDLADGLLLAAIKYDLSHLKMICVDVLSNNLTIGNAANTLLFAEKNGAVELKSNAIRFIASKYKEISETSDWKRILETKPTYAHEVCQVFADNNLGGDIMVRKYCT